MRTRFCATMRKPAPSIIALIAPVRFRSVASGLMIENVRSTAIGHSFLVRSAQSRRLIAAGFMSGKAERAFRRYDTLYHEPGHLRRRLPMRMTKSKNPEENTMIRKSILALTGIAALSAAALAPTSASAWGKGGWGHHGFGGFGFYGAGYGVNYVDVVPSCYYVKKINRFGEVRLIKVCE